MCLVLYSLWKMLEMSIKIFLQYIITNFQSDSIANDDIGFEIEEVVAENDDEANTVLEANSNQECPS